MRKVFLTLALGLCLFAARTDVWAGQYTAPGQYAGTPSAAVTSLFAQFPNGGPGLIQAIVNLLTGNPSLADDVAFVVSTSGNLAQRVATAEAFRLTIIALAGNGAAANTVFNAGLMSADPIIVAGARGGDPTNQGFLYGQDSGPNNNPGQITGCTTTTVSPTRPC